MKTITLQGKQYAPVVERLRAFHEGERGKPGSIYTYCEELGKAVVFSATVTLNDVKYTAHSYGSINSAKALEKLESVAVGRALGYAGFLASGEIATYEEMEDVEMAATADQINYITSLVETSSYTQEMRDSLDTEIFEMSYQKASEVITDLKNNQLDAVTQRGNPSKTESRDKVKDSL